MEQKEERVSRGGGNIFNVLLNTGNLGETRLGYCSGLLVGFRRKKMVYLKG